MDSNNWLLAVGTLFVLYTGAVSAASWSYSGDKGPRYWHELFPQACSGKHQSPIDIRPEQTVYNPELRDFAIWFDPPKPDSSMSVLNNGHTVQVVTNGEFYVTNGGLPYVYKTVQFHFHWGHEKHHGSEHFIDGKAYPLELHIVNYNKDMYEDIAHAVAEKQGLAVLGVLFEITEDDNPILQPLVDVMEQIQDPDNELQVDFNPISLRSLLPKDISRYFRYNGSLTTPGCFESVIWTIFEQPQTISHKQMKAFREMLQNNPSHGHHKRSVSNGRILTRSQRQREQKALAVLDELGIASNSKLQERFRRELTEKKILAEITIDEENAKNIHHKTMDHVHDTHADAGDDGDNEDADHDDENNADEEKQAKLEGADHEEKSELETEFIREQLVNNFRPVQPLNDRIVQRSFMLRTSQQSDDDNTNEELHARLKYYESTRGGASSSVVTCHLVLLACLFFFLI